MASRALIITSVLVVVIGYALYTPLPDGIAEPWKLQIVMATLKIMHATTYIGEKLGIESRLNLTRTAFSYLISSRNRDDRVQVEDRSFDGVMVRIYRPKTAADEVLPGLVYFHGGGWALFSVDSYDPLTSYIAAEAHIAVVSVEYRLAPEHPFPIPFDDCVTATVHLLRNAKNYKINPRKIGVAGDSAGGNLAAAVSLKLRDDRFEIQPRVQCLIYPVLQAIDSQSPSRIQNRFADGIITNSGVSITRYLGLPEKSAGVVAQGNHISSSLRKKYEKYLDYKQLRPGSIPVGFKPYSTPSRGDLEGLPDEQQQMFVNPYVSPLLEPDLAGLPVAYVFTAGADTLRDDGILYAKRLESSGVKTELIHVDDTFHGVFNLGGMKFAAQEPSKQTLIKFLKENL